MCLPQEDVKRLHLHVEEVIKENERLHDVIAKTGGVSQKDWYEEICCGFVCSGSALSALA